MTIEDRVRDYFGVDEVVVLTSMEERSDREDEIERALHESAHDTELVWFEWCESISHLEAEQVANGYVSLTTNVRYHPVDEEPLMRHCALVPRAMADEHGLACQNFDDVPEPVHVDATDESTLPDLDLDEDYEPDLDTDSPIPATEEEMEREQETREKALERLYGELGIEEARLRLCDFTRVYGMDQSPFFTFNIETVGGEAFRGRVYHPVYLSSRRESRRLRRE